MAFPPHFLDEIRARVPLADIIGKRVRLTRKGRELLGLCPFHNEKTPSFTVVEDKGFYHCFGCGAHGDVIGFVMRMDNLPFPEAVERLAGEAGISVPELSPEERAREKERHSLYSVVEAACVWFQKQLADVTGERARAYLASRGLGADIIEGFRVGFAPDSQGALRTALADEGISQEMLLDTGLLIKPEDDAKAPYDRFRGRIIFPIADRRGRVIAFGGRILGDGEPKYLNSPETPLFHKGAQLYGYSLAAERARRKQAVVVVEGYMDVIALHKAGITNAVAPLGTAITEAQIEALWRLVPEPVLCFDGDTAGRRAAHRAAERVLPRLRAGHSLRFAWLPEGDDPDSLIASSGAAAMRAVLGRAVGLADLLWDMSSGGDALATPERQAGVRHKLRELIRHIPDPDLRFYYESYFKNRIWNVLKAQREAKGGRRQSAALERAPSDPATLRERRLLQTLLANPILLPEFVEELGHVAFKTLRLVPLRDALVALVGDSGAAPADLIERLVAEPGLARLVDELVGAQAQARDLTGGRGADGPGGFRLELRQMLDLQRLSELERFKFEAEETFAADPTEKNLERLNSAIRMLQEAPGREEEIQD